MWDKILSIYEQDGIIEGTIIQRVKGGLLVTVFGLKAFLPGSQVYLHSKVRIDKLVGRTFRFKIIEFNKKCGSIILSRRAILEKERDEMKTATLNRLKEGKVMKGVVKNTADYGIFVDLGGISGLLHITSLNGVTHPNKLFHTGDEITVKVLKFNPETERISLGLV